MNYSILIRFYSEWVSKPESANLLSSYDVDVLSPSTQRFKIYPIMCCVLLCYAAIDGFYLFGSASASHFLCSFDDLPISNVVIRYVSL